MTINATTEANTTIHTYRHNINLQIDPWLHYFIVTSASIGLTLALLTFIFQLKHPKSRYHSSFSPSFQAKHGQLLPYHPRPPVLR